MNEKSPPEEEPHKPDERDGSGGAADRAKSEEPGKSHEPDKPDDHKPEEPSQVEPSRSAWQTEAQRLIDATLDDLLHEAARYPKPLDEEESARLSTRSAPPGYITICRDICFDWRISLSRLHRISVGHGIEILASDPAVAALVTTFRAVSNDAMTRNDRPMLSRLDRLSSYDLLYSEQHRVMLTVSRETYARCHELGHICGIYAGKLGLIASLASLITRKETREFQKGFREEVEAFLDHVVRRREELKLAGPMRNGRRARPRGE